MNSRLWQCERNNRIDNKGAVECALHRSNNKIMRAIIQAVCELIEGDERNHEWNPHAVMCEWILSEIKNLDIFVADYCVCENKTI